MNINEHAKYYKSLSLFFLLLFFPRERLVASPNLVGKQIFLAGLPSTSAWNRLSGVVPGGVESALLCLMFCNVAKRENGA